jgi:hypothetical protein
MIRSESVDYFKNLLCFVTAKYYFNSSLFGRETNKIERTQCIETRVNVPSARARYPLGGNVLPICKTAESTLNRLLGAATGRLRPCMGRGQRR